MNAAICHVNIVDAASGLADQSEARQALDQCRGDTRALSDQHHGVSNCEPFGERIDVLERVMINSERMGPQFGEAVESVDRTLVIVQYYNIQGPEGRFVEGCS